MDDKRDSNRKATNRNDSGTSSKGNEAGPSVKGEGAEAVDLLTVEQSADYLQLSTSSIRAYIRQGKLKAFRVAGLRKVLIPRAEMLKLLEPARSEEGS